jgi:hypothetical protein
MQRPQSKTGMGTAKYTPVRHSLGDGGNHAKNFFFNRKSAIGNTAPRVLTKNRSRKLDAALT